MQSGSAINPWSVGSTDIKALSNLLGLSKFDERQLLEVLQSLPVSDLLKLQEKLKDVRSYIGNLSCKLHIKIAAILCQRKKTLWPCN